MERWLEDLIDGWEFDRDRIVRHVGYYPESLRDVWDSDSATPLLAWIAARTCRSQGERESVFAAAVECALHTMQKIRSVHFDQDSILNSFEGLAGYALHGLKDERSDLGGLLRSAGAVFEHVTTARHLLDQVRDFTPLESLPDNFNTLSLHHQNALKRKLGHGEFGACHRKLPNQIALLIMNAERVWLRCYHLLHPDSPATGFSVHAHLKQFLHYDVDSNSVRPAPPE